MHSVCRETIFSVANNGEGGILEYVPFWAPWQSDWTKLAHCTSRSCILQNKTTIRPLRHILRKLLFLDKVPPSGPRGSGLDQNCTCTTRPWGQQNVTINRSLGYLVTEEIEEQDIYYGHTDGRTDGPTTDEWVSHLSSSGLWPVELKMCSVCTNQTHLMFCRLPAIATNWQVAVTAERKIGKYQSIRIVYIVILLNLQQQKNQKIELQWLVRYKLFYTCSRNYMM